MDSHYGSKAELIKHVSSKESEIYGRKRYAENKSHSDVLVTLKVCYHVTITLLLVSMIVITTIYISHLQKHVQILRARVKFLEETESKPVVKDGENVNGGIASDSSPNNRVVTPPDGEIARYVQRARRHSEGTLLVSQNKTVSTNGTESDTRRHKGSHIGIGPAQIGYIYADPQNWRDAVNTSDISFQELEVRSRHTGCNHGKLMTNGDRTIIWCKHAHPGLRDTAMLARGRPDFPLLSSSPWMASERSNYILNSKGSEMTVMHDGIYIITANMRFVGSSRGASYGVYKTNHDKREQSLLGSCNVPAQADRDGHDMYPCSIWQLTTLHAGDSVQIRISGYSWFGIDKDSFHLAVIKLSDWSE